MHTLHVCQTGTFHDVGDLSTISDYLARPESLVWLDLESPDEVEVALLRDEFGFHPLAIEDAVRDHERPKVDAYDGYYLLIFYAARYNERDQIVLQSVNLFVGGNYLVSIRRGPISEIEETMARWHAPNAPIGENTTRLLHALLDTIVDNYFTLMDRVVDRVEELEDTIFGKFREDSIQDIFRLKKDLLLLRRAVSPERDVLNVLLRQEMALFKGPEIAYIQDVYDHLVRVTDSIDTYRDLLSSALDSYLSLQSNQLNQLVKALTLASIILMSCALVSGIYGMNFMYMPELSWPLGYPLALGIMLTIAAGLGLFFKSRRWW
ncbi:magnesium/cobalt transporter CorA [Oscillochloris sp. ZM17-4]|nr:magnesium/cobalt transporter CorA [Oscillochloris sp. ZM17-4]